MFEVKSENGCEDLLWFCSKIIVIEELSLAGEREKKKQRQQQDLLFQENINRRTCWKSVDWMVKSFWL